MHVKAPTTSIEESGVTDSSSIENQLSNHLENVAVWHMHSSREVQSSIQGLHQPPIHEGCDSLISSMCSVVELLTPEVVSLLQKRAGSPEFSAQIRKSREVWNEIISVTAEMRNRCSSANFFREGHTRVSAEVPVSAVPQSAGLLGFIMPLITMLAKLRYRIEYIATLIVNNSSQTLTECERADHDFKTQFSIGAGRGALVAVYAYDSWREFGSGSVMTILYEHPTALLPEYVHHKQPEIDLTSIRLGVDRMRCWRRYASPASFEDSILNCGGSTDVTDLYHSDMNTTWIAKRSLSKQPLSVNESVENFYSSLSSSRYLMYSCNAYKPCGGTGDRINGMIQTFLLSILLHRRFVIDSDYPMVLETVLTPRYPDVIDWRIGDLTMADVSLDYIDKKEQFVNDLDLLQKEFGENRGPPVVAIQINQSLMMSVLNHWKFPIREFRRTTFLFAKLFDVLFTPTRALVTESNSIMDELGISEGEFLSIHFRAGDQMQKSWIDPARHSLSDFVKFIQCAREMERRSNSVLWLVSADVEEETVRALVQELVSRGEMSVEESNKIRIIPRLVVHIDRTESISDLVIRGGFLSSWASWLTMGRGIGMVVSRSFFSETIARITQFSAQQVLFYDGCVPTDLS